LSVVDDLYRVLRVDESADEAAIRVAYRALAAIHHPDHAGTDGEQRMRELNRAWEVLGHADRRAAYDAERKANLPPPGPVGPPWTGCAGPPPGRPSGSVLDFGIFAGWSLGEIARTDPGYLEWLEERHNAPEDASDASHARPYLEEIDGLLRRMGLRRDLAQSGKAQAAGRFRFGR
jgi:curved DNA-binding protein CbpA